MNVIVCSKLPVVCAFCGRLVICLSKVTCKINIINMYKSMARYITVLTGSCLNHKSFGEKLIPIIIKR